MSFVREQFQKGVTAVSDYFSNKGLMVGAKNPTPYFRLYRLDPSSEKSITIPTEYPTVWDRFKSTFLPKAQPVDDNIMRYVTSIIVTRSVGGSDKKKPKNECQVNIQFSVEEALKLQDSLSSAESFKPGDFDTKTTQKGDWYLDFPYFTNAQKLDEKLFITAGYLDLEPEDCVLDIVELKGKASGTPDRRFFERGRVIRGGVSFRPYEVIFGGHVTRPTVTGAENGLISLGYSVTNLLSDHGVVASNPVQQDNKANSQDSKSNADTLAKEIEKNLESIESLIKKYETGTGAEKFYEKLENLLKARLIVRDSDDPIKNKLGGSSQSNYTKLLEYTFGVGEFIFLDIPKNYIPYDPDRIGTKTEGTSNRSYVIDVANLNADKPPSFSYSKSFSDFLQRMCTAWGLAYLEYYSDDGKSIIYITTMTEFLKPSGKALSSFKVEEAGVTDYALLLRYGIEVVSFSYNQKPAVDAQEGDFTTTIWDVKENDWVTYKINKEVIRDYYKDAPDKGAMFKRIFDWAKTDPDSFVIFFTQMAGKFPEKKMSPEKIPQKAGITLSMKMKHPIPGLLPGMSAVFDVGTVNPDDVKKESYQDKKTGADPTQILPVFVSRPIYQISKVVTKLDASGTIYSQEIECEA